MSIQLNYFISQLNFCRHRAQSLSIGAIPFEAGMHVRKPEVVMRVCSAPHKAFNLNCRKGVPKFVGITMEPINSFVFFGPLCLRVCTKTSKWKKIPYRNCRTNWQKRSYFPNGFIVSPMVLLFCIRQLTLPRHLLLSLCRTLHRRCRHRPHHSESTSEKLLAIRLNWASTTQQAKKTHSNFIVIHMYLVDNAINRYQLKTKSLKGTEEGEEDWRGGKREEKTKQEHKTHEKLSFGWIGVVAVVLLAWKCLKHLVAMANNSYELNYLCCAVRFTKFGHVCVCAHDAI